MRTFRLRAASFFALCGALSACSNAPESSTQHSLTAPSADATDVSSLTPLVCPVDTTQQSSVGLIGLLGGRLTLGANQLRIPLGAVLSLTGFQITLPAGNTVEADVSAVGLTSFLFQSPVSITIDYSRCPPGAIPDGANLQVVYIDSETKQILAAMGGVNDPRLRTITFQTGHLSGYEVAY